MIALYGGYATPSETAGLGGLLALALIAVIYSVWRPSDLSPILQSTIRESTMPLLHLDARPDLVQCIKLCENIIGRGTALTRPPRLALLPHEKAEVEAIMAKALKTRPSLPNVGLKAA